MIHKFLIFTAGVVAGGMIASGVFFSLEKSFADTEKNDCIQQTSGAYGNNRTMEFFSPTFAKEKCRQWSNYAEYLMRGGYNHTNRDMVMASGLGSFLAQVELYIWSNEKAQALSGKAREDFIAQHRQWLKWWQEESKKPVRDSDGNIIEGTMAIPIQAAAPGTLIEEYLEKFPDRAKLEYDYVAEYEKNRKEK